MADASDHSKETYAVAIDQVTACGTSAMSNKFKPHVHRWCRSAPPKRDRRYHDDSDATKRTCTICFKVQYLHSAPLSRTPPGWYDTIIYR